MTEKNFIKQLKTLKSIKMDQEAKSTVFSLLQARIYTDPERFTRMSIWGLLFQPIPRLAVASLVVLLVAGSLLFSILLSKNNFYGELPATISQFKYRENGETRLVNKETNEEIGKNGEISPFPIQFNSDLVSTPPNISDQSYPVHQEQDSNSYTSIQSEEEFLANFRISLLERINRVWVQGQESGNKEVFAIAQEAEKFYKNGDYDAALRAIVVAEGLLR